MILDGFRRRNLGNARKIEANSGVECRSCELSLLIQASRTRAVCPATR